MNEKITKDTFVMMEEPLSGIDINDMWDIAKGELTSQDIAKLFAVTSNQFWWVEDDEYDYDELTPEYEKACTITDAWHELMDYLEVKLISRAKEEGLLSKLASDTIVSLVEMEPFMNKYGFKDAGGWWIPVEEVLE